MMGATMMRRRTGRVGLAPMLLAAFSMLLAGCSLEVLNPGAILDEDLNTPELMPIVVNGVSAEFNNVPDALAYNVARLTDDMSGTGSYFETGRFRRGLFDDEDSEGTWEQMHEAAWAAGVAWERLLEVLGEDAARNSVDSAKLFALMGHAHRMLGENFCDLAYDKGPLQPRTAAFDSALVAFDQAITIGTSAGSSADDWVTSAHAGRAQAYVGLGDWGSAVAEASQVPIDFVHNAIYADGSDTNVVWSESHGRAELGVWASPAQYYGDPIGLNDPRTPYRICGNWNDPNDPSAGVTTTGTCSDSGSGAHQGADGATAHYRQQKHTGRGSDIAVASGTEMMLIRAEAALLDGDLTTFIDRINDVRDFYGLTDLAEPPTAGALEFPNALDAQPRAAFPTGGDPGLDDGWSILDRERYMTLWVEGRRLWDLWRWDHPFLAGGTLIGAGENPRASCMPIPRIECTLNENLAGSSACS